VEKEEIEYFATGHPIVEALFGFLRDGPYGRSGVRFIEKRGSLKVKGLELLFHVQAPEAEDTQPGARVPSRQLSRFVDRLLIPVVVVQGADGVPHVHPELSQVLITEGRSLRGEEARAAFPNLSSFVGTAVAVGLVAAEAVLRDKMKQAKSAVESEREQVLRRLRLSLAHQGLSAEAAEPHLAAERSHYAALLGALSQLTVTLDSACAFVVNR
jgi:ATP-dependent helicase HepA